MPLNKSRVVTERGFAWHIPAEEVSVEATVEFRYLDDLEFSNYIADLVTFSRLICRT